MPIARLKWEKRPGPRMRRTFRQARATYVCGDYRIEWHGSTHGVWQLRVNGAADSLHSTLKTAKERAERHMVEVVNAGR